MNTGPSGKGPQHIPINVSLFPLRDSSDNDCVLSGLKNFFAAISISNFSSPKIQFAFFYSEDIQKSFSANCRSRQKSGNHTNSKGEGGSNVLCVIMTQCILKLISDSPLEPTSNLANIYLFKVNNRNIKKKE